MESHVVCLVLLCEHLFDLIGGQRNRANARERVDPDPARIFYASRHLSSCESYNFCHFYVYPPCTALEVLFSSHNEVNYSRKIVFAAAFAVFTQWHGLTVIPVTVMAGCR